MDSFNARTGKENAAKASEALTELVTHIVLNWEPARHEDSLYEVAAVYVGTTAFELRDAVEGNPYYRITVEYASGGRSSPIPFLISSAGTISTESPTTPNSATSGLNPLRHSRS